MSLPLSLPSVYPRVCGGTQVTLRNNFPGLCVCGGTRLLMVEKGEEEGLSPRVRGNLPCFASYVTVIGSIPACAGEPRQVVAYTHLGRVYPRVCGGTYS